MVTPEQRKQVLASRLRAARENFGWSQQAVAEELGLHRPSLTMIELGRRHVSAFELLDLVTLYETSLPVILEDL